MAGQETVIAFHLINYGYERNEITYTLGEDLEMLLWGGSVESYQAMKEKLQQDEMRALMEDRHGTPVVATKKTPEGPHGKLELLFPEGCLLKNDGEPLLVILRLRAPLSHAVSFTSHVRFHVEGVTAARATSAEAKAYKRRFLLPIHGVVDSSYMTLWPILELCKCAIEPVDSQTGDVYTRHLLERLQAQGIDVFAVVQQ
jgi:hypothetical protein